MSGYVNPVFRPDFMDYPAPPQNRLAAGVTRYAGTPVSGDEPLADMPSPYARVPPDTASDIGPSVMGHWIDPRFAVYRGPDTGDFPDAGAMPSNEQLQDVARQQRMSDIMRQLTEMMNAGVGQTYADRARFDALRNEYQTLGTQSPGYRYNMRLSDVHRQVPADADVMMQAMQRRQQLGRDE